MEEKGGGLFRGGEIRGQARGRERALEEKTTQVWMGQSTRETYQRKKGWSRGGEKTGD